VRRGSLFAARASTLLRLYRQHQSLEDLDEDTRQTLELTYFRCPLDEVWGQTTEYYRRRGRCDVIEKAERDPRQKMALVFRWYFAKTVRDAMAGTPEDRANYQIHCGPALGAFNRIVRGTALELVTARHVDAIAELLMTGAANVLTSVAQG
jgi:trans-AT polyketide synthase/acyltransferase/oxidoreductase domain-containing protein